ncbi:MAG TPA: hypothetical protein PK711_07370 [Bacteroidales bacterium]|nr:hypothetical protein [Bacteroidales bacterium]
MKKAFFIVFFGISWDLFLSAVLLAQDPWIHGPFRQGILPEERIMLITDRDLYIAGENIWFSANYMSINTSDEKQVSHVLYIEVFNSVDDVIIREKYSIQHGNASGYLTIPAETATDAYILRAYTHFQRNFPAESHTMKCLTIVNPDIPYLHKLVTSNKIAIIPEGGNFVSGVPARTVIRLDRELAEKITYMQLLDEHQRPVASVRMFENGLGECTFTPDDSLDYHLAVYLENGDTLVEPLPAQDTWGDFLPSAEKRQSGLIYRLSGKIPFTAGNDHPLSLTMISAEGLTLYKESIPQQNIPVQIEIPYPEKYRGILYLVLKSSEDAILHILPVFIPGKPVEEIKLTTDKTDYQRREPVTVGVTSATGDDRKLQVTVSVVKEGTWDPMDSLLHDNYIRNPFLLHSFSLTGGMSTAALTSQADLCMILYTPLANTALFRSGLTKADTEGITFLPEIRDVSISGQVVRAGSRTGVEGVPVVLSILGQSQIHMVQSNVHGRFVFSLDNLENWHDLVLCPQPKENQDVEILINQDFSGQFPEQLFLVPDLDSSRYSTVEQAWINAQLMQVNAPAGVTAGPEIRSDILFAEDRHVVVLSDYIEMKNLYEVFWEIVPFVQIRKKKDHYHAQLTNDRMEVFEDPLILLDDVPVSSVDELLKIPPALVERIESINHPYLHGDFVWNGVIMVYTKTDNFAGSSFPRGSIFLDYQTITPLYLFPEYDYLMEEQKASKLPDFRNTLHWDPGLILAGEEKQFSFYTSDHCGEYEVVVRGMSEGGLSYYGKACIQVTDRNR